LSALVSGPHFVLATSFATSMFTFSHETALSLESCDNMTAGVLESAL
jgi:hypothetical protein